MLINTIFKYPLSYSYTSSEHIIFNKYFMFNNLKTTRFNYDFDVSKISENLSAK